MKYLLISMLLSLNSFSLYAQEADKRDALITTQVAIDDKYPIVVVDHVPYCLFGLPDPGTGRPRYYFPVTAETKKNLSWIKDVELKDAKLRFYWYIPSRDGNAPLINGISVSVSKIADQETPTLDPKVNASEFIRTIEKEFIIKDECEVSHCLYEYCVDRKPTGKYLSFEDVESEIASIDKSYKPRKMILSSKDKAVQFVHVKAYYHSGK